MAEPKKVTQEEYDEFRSNMEEKYGYEDMSDEEKADFDEKIDQVAVVGEKTDKMDETDGDDSDDGDEMEKGEFENGIPQEHDGEDGNVR